MPHDDTLLWGPEVWAGISRAATRKGKRYLACAYAGRHAAALVPLAAGDVAVVDASPDALRAGQTSPDAVEKWLRAKAHVYSYGQLHAKVYLLGGCAFIGSANASRRSQETLLEAVLHSDRAEVRQQVREMVLELAKLAARPLDLAWLPEARALYRPPRVGGRLRRPGDEQVLPPGRFRLYYSAWQHQGQPVSTGIQHVIDELSGPGVDIWTWHVEAAHGLHVDDVVVLMSVDANDQQVELWPPMRVLRLSPVVRGQQSLFLRASRKLAPLPAVDARVRNALRGVRTHTFPGPQRRARLLDLWDLHDHQPTGGR